MGFFEDGENLFAEIYLLRRGTRDIVKGKNRIYHYRDSETMMEIPVVDIKKRVPCRMFSPKTGLQTIVSEFSTKAKKVGAIYINEAVMQDGRIRASQPVELQLLWFHYNPGAIENIDQLHFSQTDIATGMLCVFKTLFFDRFVSALSPSWRRKPIYWNVKSWRWILKAARGDVTAMQCYNEIGELSRNGTEIFYGPELCLPILVHIMSGWMTDYEHLNLYEAVDAMKRQEQVLEEILDYYDEKLANLAQETMKKDNKKYMLQKLEDDQVSKGTDITDGSGTTAPSTEPDEREGEIFSSDCESTDDDSANTSDLVESDSEESEYE